MRITFYRGALSERPNGLTFLAHGAFAAILLSYLGFLEIDAQTAQKLSDEDGIVEYLGAAFSLIAACLFLACYLRSDGEANRLFGVRRTRNVWFLGLALLMFVSFGEEISWGQRIFGWETPELISQVNAQGETNIHNLWFMQATTPDGSRKSSFELLFNANRLYSLFWLAYCVALPLLFAYWERLKRLVLVLGLPIPPLVVGGLFLTNFLVFKLVATFGGLEPITLSALDELKETIYASAFLMLGLHFLADQDCVDRPRFGRQSNAGPRLKPCSSPDTRPRN